MSKYAVYHPHYPGRLEEELLLKKTSLLFDKVYIPASALHLYTDEERKSLKIPDFRRAENQKQLEFKQ